MTFKHFRHGLAGVVIGWVVAMVSVPEMGAFFGILTYGALRGLKYLNDPLNEEGE